MDRLIALSDDFEEIIPIIEKSLNIQFAKNDLIYVQTFGEFCDVIKLRLDRENTNSCTSQQAFYKIRDAICKVKLLDKYMIEPSTRLNDIFSKDTIRKDFKDISDIVGLKFSYFRPKRFISTILITLILISFIMIFIKPLIGVIGLVISISLLKLAYGFSKQLDFSSVGDLANKLATFNYAQIRRFSNTANLNEIEKIVSKIITDSLGIDGELKYSTRFELK